jgi:small GTP-binding protein
MNSNQKPHDMILKVVFVGDSGVGKTSLLRREVENSFTGDHIATIGVDFRIKNYKIGKINAKVQLWDTAGQ